MRRALAVLTVVVIAFAAIPARATIIAGGVANSAMYGGRFIKLTVPLSNPLGPPNSVGQDNFNQPNLYGFDEDQNILLTRSLSTDVGKNPLPPGTTVASHYVFFDPGSPEDILGTVEFDSHILAVITSTDNLAASDFLAKTGVHYLNPGARGLEAGDYVSISGPNEITFNTRASSPGDYVRVLTEFSPKARRVTSVKSDPLFVLASRLFVR